jgi:general stress protein YciG
MAKKMMSKAAEKKGGRDANKVLNKKDKDRMSFKGMKGGKKK